MGLMGRSSCDSLSKNSTDAKKGSEPLQQIIAISQITMKRLLNYQRVTEKKANMANKHQWIKMTLENMRKAEETRRTAMQINAAVSYAGYLFRVQNNMSHYHTNDCEGLLHNSLVTLMNRLDIAVEMVAVDK